MFEFDFIQNDLFVNQMIDVGSNSIPILYDLNNDGLLDLIIGNKGYYNEANYDSKLKLYKNIGTEIEPKFSYIMDDFGGLCFQNFRISSKMFFRLHFQSFRDFSK